MESPNILLYTNCLLYFSADLLDQDPTGDHRDGLAANKPHVTSYMTSYGWWFVHPLRPHLHFNVLLYRFVDLERGQ